MRSFGSLVPVIFDTNNSRRGIYERLNRSCSFMAGDLADSCFVDEVPKIVFSKYHVPM